MSEMVLSTGCLGTLKQGSPSSRFFSSWYMAPLSLGASFLKGDKSYVPSGPKALTGSCSFALWGCGCDGHKDVSLSWLCPTAPLARLLVCDPSPVPHVFLLALGQSVHVPCTSSTDMGCAGPPLFRSAFHHPSVVWKGTTFYLWFNTYACLACPGFQKNPEAGV